jgi:hypothetical protein
MYLFSRRAHLAPGNTRAGMTWILDITEKANQITGLDVSAFMSVFSPEVGTVVWSAFVPDLAALETAADKLIADDGYVVLIDEGARLVQGSTDDALMQIVHGEPRPGRRVEYASTVQAVCAPGNVARGMELGVEIAQRAEQVTGTPTMLGAPATGPYGALAWLSGFADIQAMDRAQQALAADAGFMRFIDENTAGVYVDDFSITRQLIYRRVV